MRYSIILSCLLSLLALGACAGDGEHGGGDHDAHDHEEHDHGGEQAAADDGWRPLFDGVTTAGWMRYDQGPWTGGWEAQDGALVMVGGGGDIVTEEEFEDFELELEWQVGPGGNSGIFFNVVDGLGAVYASGPEVQVLDNTTHPDGKNVLTSAGSCYALYAPERDVTRPAGQWNQARLLSKDGHVQHWLNGTLLCEYTIGSDDWNARVAASKFKDMPQFGSASRGRIALQDHGDRVAFRNLRIREL